MLNTYSYDAYILKALVLKQRKVYSSSEIGTTFRFICSNIDGSRRMDVAVQNSQSLSLTLPYAFIGIGRSSNYIENFQIISGNFINVKD